MGAFAVSYSAGGVLDKVKELNTVNEVTRINEVGKIVGFATKHQPYNTMRAYDIPALAGEYEFEMLLPSEEVEILAMSLTCSGYGEDDHYDLEVNGQKWFDNWYCSEVKEGLFLGTSTYVYLAPPSSNIKLTFKNDSGTSKKIWLGIRMLIDNPNY